jgi:hypothetical protein
MLQIKQTDDLDFATVPTIFAPASAMMPIFHSVSRAEGLYQQTGNKDGNIGNIFI